MTLDELIAWVSEQAAYELDNAAQAERGRFLAAAQYDRQRAAVLISVENALRRLREIERDHGGEV